MLLGILLRQAEYLTNRYYDSNDKHEQEQLDKAIRRLYGEAEERLVHTCEKRQNKALQNSSRDYNIRDRDNSGRNGTGTRKPDKGYLD